MIKAITESDLHECHNILKSGYEDNAVKFAMTEENCPHRGRTRLPFDKFQKEFTGGHEMYGYFHNDKIVGFLSIKFSEKKMDICDMVILPEVQNNGFGTALLNYAKEKAKENKCGKITLGMVDDNTKLKHWYEKHGFKTVDFRKYDKVIYTIGKMEFIL